jgi:hypothetical protein
MNRLTLAAFLINLLIAIVIIVTQKFSWWLMLAHIESLMIFSFFILRVFKPGLPKATTIGILIALFMLSMLIRLYQIETITPGVYGDEVTVGITSLELLNEDQWLPFLGSTSHPTPLMYLTAVSLHVFGRNPTALRLPSVIFGSLLPLIFFVFINRFISLPSAVYGSFLMVVLYPLIAISRLAYEPAATLFFQITSLMFLYQLLSTRLYRYVLPLSVSLGLGLYTYLNFRIFFLLASLYIFHFLFSHRQHKWLAIFIAGLFISTMPLLVYSLIDPQGFWQRPAAISIFARHYTPLEFTKELSANFIRSSLFFLTPDPNPAKNPSHMPLIDGITTTIAFIGIFLVVKKNRALSTPLTILMAASFLSDILSTEVIPDFHYYGLGHPHTLRISGIIPVIVTCAAIGLESIAGIVGKKVTFHKSRLAVGGIVLVIAAINLHWYFGQQQLQPKLFAYNHRYNQAGIMNLVSIINQTSFAEYKLPESVHSNEKSQLFIASNKKLTSHTVSSAETLLATLNQNTLLVLEADNVAKIIVQEIATGSAVLTGAIHLDLLTYPGGSPEYILVQQSVPKR